MNTGLALKTFPFSRRGSWINFYQGNPKTLSSDGSTGPLSLRVVAGTHGEAPDVFHVGLESKGGPVSWTEVISPGLLALGETNGVGSAQIAFQDESTVRMRADGVSIRLDLCRNERLLKIGANGWAVRAGSYGWLLIAAVSGKLVVENEEGHWALCLKGESEPAELLIYRTNSGAVPPDVMGTLEDCAVRSENDLQTWLQKFPEVPEEFQGLRKRELWNVWNLTVHPLGNFKREVVLVSKVGLIGLWSWDHCWHMLGTAEVDQELSWNCMMALFDHQDTLGALPDVTCVNQLLWGFLKPPVHGWMLGLLEHRCSWFGDKHRREIYPAVVRMTRYWLSQRKGSESGMPCYLDGFDSGWDNATAFDKGFPAETPDLATWLILQEEWLAQTARQLGLTDEAAQWESEAQTLLSKMLDRYWTGEKFVGRKGDTDEVVISDSVILRIPLLLGDRIPSAARKWCLDGLLQGGRYRTHFGILTEPPDSLLFEPDGYWRGPMWPVVTFIFVEAFRANGLYDEAEALAVEYLRHVNSEGNFENYRGDNGKGVRDTSIAWTSTVALSFLSS